MNTMDKYLYDLINRTNLTYIAIIIYFIDW